MNAKVNSIWQKVKEVICDSITALPSVLLTILITTFILFIVLIIKGVIISICWNVAITTMFGLNKITILQAFILAFTIGYLRSSITIKVDYKTCKEHLLKKYKNYKIVKILSIILTLLFKLLTILITIWTVMYSWNNIMPQLLNVELVQINFIQASGFAYLFNHLFGIPKSDDKESKKDEENNNEIVETENDSEDIINTAESSTN